MTEDSRTRVRNKRNFPIPDRIIKDGKKVYTCWECDFASPKTTLVYNHYENRHLVRRLKCEICEKFFPSERAIKKHRRQIHEELIKCKYCDARIPRIKMKRHEELKHLRPYKCDECDSTFGYNTSLISHKMKVHEQKMLEPRFVSCIWCNATIDIRNNSFQNHMSTKSHKSYVRTWLEYNQIESIPCHLCEEWSSDNMDAVLKHLNTQHRLGSEKCMEYLSTFGCQDPALLLTLTMKERKEYVINNFEIRESLKAAPTNITCFVCFKLIPMTSRFPDKNLMIHINNSMSKHLDHDEDFKMLHKIGGFPCVECGNQELHTLQMALQHVQNEHGSSQLEYFEYLRSEFAPFCNSGKQSHCFICSKDVFSMEQHMRNQIHRVLEKRWTRMEQLTNFPCSVCGSFFASPFETATHALETHNQPFAEYMQFLQITFLKYNLD